MAYCIVLCVCNYKLFDAYNGWKVFAGNVVGSCTTTLACTKDRFSRIKKYFKVVA
jgi:hypothetical protein